MSAFSLKPMLIAVTVGLFSISAYSDSTTQPNSSFQSVCINSWMSKGEQATDKVDYKNFGEKYCACASTQPLDNQEAIKKAIQLCLSRTLLHDAMDSLEEEIGLSDAKAADLTEYCQDKWSLIYPKQTEEDKKFTTSYCECAQPKLMELIKKSETITDKEYDQSIDTIAGDCSGNVKEEQTGTSTTSTTTN
ncbi:hypothetical protein [Legionella quateirensis]|uniref:Uncharacterized protein n=1 Tax=Legionella quateirensis TaxID=45072 RepID=A0A378KTG2_9GAMM|nr:hypothetical protein [Legionella quateirensis]KTD50879.1 hypothetical protein Lqua_1106 [Legionella quateirensis]STY17875.1 Uncharacterised protein [Legionella quateirensis]